MERNFSTDGTMCQNSSGAVGGRTQGRGLPHCDPCVIHCRQKRFFTKDLPKDPPSGSPTKHPPKFMEDFWPNNVGKGTFAYPPPASPPARGLRKGPHSPPPPPGPAWGQARHRADGDGSRMVYRSRFISAICHRIHNLETPKTGETGQRHAKIGRQRVQARQNWTSKRCRISVMQ